MDGTGFAILAYVLGLGLIWGYAAWLWIASRRLSKAGEGDGGAS